MAKKSSIEQFKTLNLDIGCGKRKQDPTWTGMDAKKYPGVDIVHDPLKFPWPLPDNCAATVVMHHLWPRIPRTETLKFMAELHRICCHEARIFMTGPFGMGPRYISNPTYCNPTNELTFMYWDKRCVQYEAYEPPPFELRSFTRVPVNFDVDFNVVLVCLKKEKLETGLKQNSSR